MSPTPPNRADTIFGDALDLPSGEREAHVVAACGDDGDLLAEVRALLAAHEAVPTEFLSGDNPDLDATIATGGSGQTSGKPAGPVPGTRGPATQPAAAASPSEMPGELIGRYKLLQEIGEGGFGTVWMAEQTEPVTRRVALKIIKLGMDTKEVIARFEAERQALAMMDDENIAKVFDAGATDKGRPYFVMELVKGVPITEYCDEAGLDTRERLALFADVCSALQHAHQKGIIHRDIKPNNVMVTLHGDKPVVKVIDFGIAKATQGKLTEKTLFTHFDQVIGTPVYMSPEQASLSGLDIDTRSDIYALGVLLYELLTGKPPFDAKTLLSGGYEEMRRIIREDEPPKPSVRLSTVSDEDRTDLAKVRKIDPEKLSRLVASDLDWIVMKAIDKDRARRYETANAFGQDIGAFLADEPVSASPPSATYRLGKFARRNKVALATATTLVLTLLAAVAVSTWQAVEANKAREDEAEQREIAETNAEEAKTKEEEAKAVLAFFQDKVLAAARPKGQYHGLGVDATIKEAIDAAEPQIATAFADRPVVEASIRFTLGATYSFLGEPKAAIVQHGRALELNREVLGAEHPDTLMSMLGLAPAYFDVGRHEEALTLTEKTMGLMKKVLGTEKQPTMRTMSNLATIYRAAGRHEESLALYEEVLALQQKVLGAEHSDTLASMSAVNSSAGRRAESITSFEETLEKMKRWPGAEHPDTLRAMSQLVIAYFDAGRYQEAITLNEETLGLRRKVLPADHPDTLKTMNNMANAYFTVGRLNEALTLSEETLELRKRVLSAEHRDTLVSMSDLANIYRAVGRLEESLALYEEVVQLRKKVIGAEHPATLESIYGLGFSHLSSQHFEDAESLFREWIAIRKKQGADDGIFFYRHSVLGLSLIQQKKYAEAEPWLLAGYKGVDSSSPKPESNYLRPCIQSLVKLYTDWGKPGKAAEWTAKLKEFDSEETRSSPEISGKKPVERMVKMKEPDPEPGEYRSFTDIFGQKSEARIVKVERGQVFLEDRKGAEMSLSLKGLPEEEQKAVQDWMKSEGQK